MHHPLPDHQPVYDYQRFGRHRLRAPAAILVDVPTPIGPGARVWVATIWPDPNVPPGWTRMLWPSDPARGGWRLPDQLAAGDVIEFGADSHHGPVRWYGIVDSYLAEQLTVQGPYAHPVDADDEAQKLLAAERFLPALGSAPSVAPVDKPGSVRSRCRRAQRPNSTRPGRWR